MTILTPKKRKSWKAYFDAENIRFVFFSALLAADPTNSEELMQALNAVISWDGITNALIGIRKTRKMERPRL